MPNKHYNRGSAFERRIKRELEDAGYFVVKSGGSKGPVDLCAIDGSGNPYLLQCRKDGRLSKEDLAKLEKLGEDHRAAIVLTCKPKRNESVQFEYLYFPAVCTDELPIKKLGWKER